MTKTKSVIPLHIKTDNFGPIVFRTKDKVVHFYQYYGIMPDMGDENHNLYFIEEDCKEGDICLWNIQHEYKINVADSDNALMHYKIVATTDSELIKKGIPEISDEYVKHYCYKNGDINSVDIEMDSIYVEPPGSIHSNRGHFIEIPKLKDLKEVVIYHEPAPIVDWNSFTMTQFIEHLEEKFKFSSTGTAKAVIELIKSNKDMRKTIFDIHSQATRKNRASDAKELMETDLEIIEKKCNQILEDE